MQLSHCALHKLIDCMQDSHSFEDLKKILKFIRNVKHIKLHVHSNSKCGDRQISKKYQSK